MSDSTQLDTFFIFFELTHEVYMYGQVCIAMNTDLVFELHTYE